MTHEEEEEVRSLLSRHQERIMLDLSGTELLAVLVKNSVLTQSEEDLLLKSYPLPVASSSAPPSVALSKRKLSAVISSGSGSSNSGGGGCNSSIADSSANNSRCASVNGDHAISDNRSITPSVVVGSISGGSNSNCDVIGEQVGVYGTKNFNSINDADLLRAQCANLIDIIAKSGFEKFKQFCYAIENECPQLIEDLINDRLKCETTIVNTSANEEKIQKELETIDYIEKENENDRNRRAVSYSGTTPNSGNSTNTTLPRAAPRRVSLMKDPPPPPPPKPAISQQLSQQNSSKASPIPSKYPQSDYNLIQKIDSMSMLAAPAQYQPQNFYANTPTINSSGNSNNYSSLLCHSASTNSPQAVRKRDKLLHRFSDAATLGRKLKKKKNTNRTCRSMTEAIEMLADPVIEDEFFGDRTTWEYHTVSVTRVPGYGFGIAVSGGRDNPHFANGDPSIAVSDVLKGGPAEDRLQVNDRIISVNGVSLENVEYATAVQVLRDSGNTVTLVVKRRVPLNVNTQHQHSHSMSSVGLATATNSNGLSMQSSGGGVGSGMSSMSQPNSLNSSMINNGAVTPGQPIKVTLTKNSKKDDYGIVLGCRLFIKEISAKARDQLAANGYLMQEGDTLTRIHNTNCGDTMSLKEAKKIIDGCKERLNLVVLRDITNQSAAVAVTNQLNNSTTQANLYASHQAQISNCSNNLDETYMGVRGGGGGGGGGDGPGGYSSQNLYVQPPTRSSAGLSNGLNDEKSNLTPRGRSRGPLMDGGVSLSQLDRPVTPPNGTSSRTRSDDPPRPPPPRGSSGANNGNEDFYSSRRQLYEDDSLQRSRQTAEPRFISFQKEGSVGIRLTGGNEAGIFVTAVQPGSPASLQGLSPGDKILKVNDMDMLGVTREEAVLFLLSLQDRIDLIVQYCKEEYDEVVTNQRGDSFHIKTHFHCDNPSKGEMAFKAGDVFRVIDTLHNGVVGSWQVLKIGRGHQEMQRGVIPNKSRAEELATAQFNATKKEMNANESRGNFFRRRRSTHRRSKSLNRENWDDVVFSDSISKFPAYERVVLRHPGFVRPVVLFGPVSDVAREKLIKDFPDKYTAPLHDDDKSNSKCRIVRLSNIRDIMDRGKHALLDITPNAVDRLNYAQFYPIVIFLKTDNKHVIKQLRQGLPKSAHKSSKKLLDQCQKLERVWSHVFSSQIVLNDQEAWYRKLRDAIDLQQSGAVWMSESKLPDSPTEMIFPPYIAPPCNFPCCQPTSSISVPRFTTRRRNSFSLLSIERPLTPPRPLVSNYEPPAYNSIPAEQPAPRITSYNMIPILKPATSMPGGLANNKHQAELFAAKEDENVIKNVDDNASLYHSSQPNLLSNFRSDRMSLPKQDNLSISSTALATSTQSNLTLNNSYTSGPSAAFRGNRGTSTERRTSPYYYNELFQRPNVFDSNLNLLNGDEKKNITNGGEYYHSATAAAAAAAGASITNGYIAGRVLPKPQQRRHSSSARLSTSITNLSIADVNAEDEPVESLSDDFLFPMTTSRLSYASSPESDLELSPGPSASLSLGNLPQLVKSSSDPSIATNQDNLDRDRDIIGEGLPPPYTNPYDHTINPPANRRQTLDSSKFSIYAANSNIMGSSGTPADSSAPSTRPQSLYGINAPDLPPRIDRHSKPGPGDMPPPAARPLSSGGTLGRSAQERLFGKPIVNEDVQAEYISRNATDSMDRQQASLERQARMNAAVAKQPAVGGMIPAQAVQQNGSYDSVSSYDSYNTAQLTMQNLGRLGPNAPDDLKSVPNANAGRPLPAVVGMNPNMPEYARSSHDHHGRNFAGANDLNRQNSPGRQQYHDMNSSRNIDPRNGPPQRPSNLGLEGSPRKPIVETKTDYGKYSRNNSASQADYSKLPKNPHMVVPPPNLNGNSNSTPSSNGSGAPFKPVPPPKPKNYRPPMQGGPGQWENGESGSPRSPNGFYYPPNTAHHHYSQQTPGSPHQGPNVNMQPQYGSNGGGGGSGNGGGLNSGPYGQQQHYPPTNGGYNGSTSHHYNGGSGTGPYIAPHRGMPPPIGNLPPHTPERHALDLAGSREQRGSAFELYRKPQLGTAGHHHNLSEMEPYSNNSNERYDNYYSMPPPPTLQSNLPPRANPVHRSRSTSRYTTDDLPPNPQDPNFYNYQIQQQQHQQYYNENEIMQPPPPLPPHKIKKKSMLKSQLAAIKNALIKTTRPLRRMNSMVEPERKTKSCIKRQHSLLERNMQRPYYPDEYPTYPAGFEERYYGRAGSVPPHALMSQDQYYHQKYQYSHSYSQQEAMNSTYQNLETEDIYGNIGSVPRMHRTGRPRDYNGYDPDGLYANRALIDLERRQAEAAAMAASRNGRRIVRRHSTTTADREGERRRPIITQENGDMGYEEDDIYQSRQGAYMLDAQQRRAPSSEVMTRRRFYPGAANELCDQQEPLYQTKRDVQREMQRNHLYQSKKEMQERIALGKKEIQREFSPQHSSSQSDRSERESIYQSRRELKESGIKARAQLRDQIYQTRREALDSMAEPSYISKRDMGRPEPIYESKEESILHHRENETDEKKEEKSEVIAIAEINQGEETLSRSDLQNSTDTVIENVTATVAALAELAAQAAPLVQGEKDFDGELLADESDAFEQVSAIESNNLNMGMLEDGSNVINETVELSDEVFDAPTTVKGPPIEAIGPPKPTMPLSPRSARSPFHISNILKRTGPPTPTPATISDSRTSIETQYTSQASLPVGPPNATSTPYTSNMSLPIAGPVPNSEGSANAQNPFPSMPREPTTTRGIFDSNGGTLSDNVWNVSLQIPPGAIAQGVRQEIYFTVSDPRMGEAVGGPPLDMENGETMLSPLVMCGPQGLEFLVPVTLNIPHCAGRTASLGLALKATDSEKNLHTEWDNIDLPSNAAAHTVSVKVDHF